MDNSKQKNMSRDGLKHKNQIHEIDRFIKSKNYSHVTLVADKNTYASGGPMIEDVLNRIPVGISRHIFNDTHLLPDECAVGRLIMALEPDPGLIIALGSGTINDICRFVASRLKIGYISVPTAASMDGYASGVAAMITDMQKTTFTAVTPSEIFADYSLYRSAPMIMNIAGFGDVIGKHTALADWKLGCLIQGEPYDEGIAAMMRAAVDGCMDAAEGLLNGDKQALIAQMDALLLSGVAMSLAGSSRPASGAEHHMSHFYEAAALREGKTPLLHGTYVAESTWTIIRMHELLLERESDIKKIYPQKWTDICDTLSTAVPDKARLLRLCELLSSPLTPADIGVGKDLFTRCVIEAMHIRPRYTVLRMCDELGLLRELAEIMAKEFFCK